MRTKAAVAGVLLTLSAVAASASPYRLVTVAEGLDFPWCVAFLPDGAMLVTELGGTLRRISPNGDVGDPIPGVPAVHRQAQGGLFDVLPHPDFARNQTVFLSYAALPVEDNATEILRARLVDGALTDAKVIFAVTPAQALTRALRRPDGVSRGWHPGAHHRRRLRLPRSGAGPHQPDGQDRAHRRRRRRSRRQSVHRPGRRAAADLLLRPSQSAGLGARARQDLVPPRARGARRRRGRTASSLVPTTDGRP